MPTMPVRARWLGNHDKLPVHEPEAAVLSSAMAGRIKSKKYPLILTRLTSWTTTTASAGLCLPTQRRGRVVNWHLLPVKLGCAATA